MSKTTRLLAMILAVLMTVSLLTVITFAATPVFATDYVDPTGTIFNSAVYVNPSLKGKTGKVTGIWDGITYEFTMGKNAFGTLEEGLSGAELNVTGNKNQVLLAAGDYGELTISAPIDIFGVGWNSNPNAVNSTDPTKPWGLSSAWSSATSSVANVVISAGAYEDINICGIRITGRIYDFYRPVSSTATILKFKNILFSQTTAGTQNTYTNSSTSSTNTNYAMTFRGPNANNSKETGKFNKDELHFINFRVEELICTRFIDEQVPPKVIFDGFYFPGSKLSDQGFWMKWMPYFDNCEFTIKNSCFNGVTTKSNALHFEGFGNGVVGDGAAKLAVGAYLEGQYAEFNMLNNLFYNVYSDHATIAMNLQSFSKVNIDGNYIVNTDTSLTGWFFGMSYVIKDDDYTNKFFCTNNTFLGQSKLEFTHGSYDSKAEFTGNYIASTYDTDWKNGESNLLPSGKVRFDYCYLDGARTRKTSDIPEFDLSNAELNKTQKTISAAVAVGQLSFEPTVTGSLSKYEIYESDENFSNADDFDSLNPVTSATLKNLENYFLFVAYSYDLNTTSVYEMTVTRPASENISLSDLSNNSVGSKVSKDGLIFNVEVDREMDTFSFELDTNADSAMVSSKNMGYTPAVDNGVYTVSRLNVNATIVLQIDLTKGDETETYFVNVTRVPSDKCDIVSIDSSLSKNGSTYSVDLTEFVDSFEFEVEISDYATAAVWQGTTVYPLGDDGVVVVKDLKSGENKFTLGVMAENAVDYELYTLIINNPKSSAAELISIKDATKTADGFKVTTASQFKVEATVSDGATYKVYTDAACKNLAPETLTITETTKFYIVVTAENGTTKSAPYELVVEKAKEGITIKDATLMEDGAYIIELPKDLESYTLDITAFGGASYKLYADSSFKTACSKTLKLDQALTGVYAKVKYSNGTEEPIAIVVMSQRSSVKFADADKIPNWAKVYANALNESGLGIIKGDDNGNFNANNYLTRYEVAAIAVRILGIDATQFANVKLTYKDSIAKWAENYVKAVTALGIMSGTTNDKGEIIFNGKATTTRSQIAKIIVELSFRYFGLEITPAQYYAANKAEVDAAYNAYKFVDESSVQDWAKVYVKLAVYSGYIEGSVSEGKNYVNGKNNITRAQMAAITVRFIVGEA